MRRDGASVTSLGWTLLELLVPMGTWLHLELTPMPQFVLSALLLAVVGSLLIAVGAAVVRVARVVARVAPTVSARLRTVVAGATEACARVSRVGAQGPRAPTSRGVSVFATI